MTSNEGEEHTILPECVDRLARLEEGQKHTHDNFKNLLDNHLPHLQDQIDKVDNRLWWVLGSVIAAAVLSVALKLIGG